MIENYEVTNFANLKKKQTLRSYFENFVNSFHEILKLQHAHSITMDINTFISFYSH